MGDNMSKRLKLIAAPEAEMEERSFPNPYPDWEPGDASSDAENKPTEPLDAEGKVARPSSNDLNLLNATVSRQANVSLALASVSADF